VDLCPECIGNIERKSMLGLGLIDLYLYWKTTDSGKRIPSHVGNWIDEGLRFDVKRWRIGKHNIAGQRVDVWFNCGGHVWWGWQVGYHDLVYCRRTKVKS
jgi:hypothetical protein